MPATSAGMTKGRRIRSINSSVIAGLDPAIQLFLERWIAVLKDGARDWPYSSFHAYVRRGLKPADWADDVDEPMMNFGERRG